MLGRRKEDVWDGTERRSPPVVLVVNDDEDACEMLVRMIGAKGYRTIGATTAEDATGHLVAELPRCIVLDLEGGGVGTNLKVLDLIRSHDDKRVSVARVVLCAASPRNRSFSFQSGADSFVVRPFHIDDLVAQIADVVDRPDKERARHRRDELARLGD
jgi:DNA-binding response OmpR family regulator